MNKAYKSLRTALATSFGTMLEFYDFTLYGVFAVLFAKLIFPDNEHATIYSLLIYALGSFLRPIGGIVFGYISDLKGRKISLLLSVLIMALSTLGMGLLPVYEDIGMWSLVLLVGLRCGQGFSAGGEFNNTTMYALESNSHRPGLYSGVVVASATVGTLCAVALCGLVLATEHPQAWRVPFLLGGCLGIIGFLLRSRLPESPMFIGEARAKPPSLIKNIHLIFANYKKALVTTIIVGAYASALGFTIFNYVNIYLSSIIGYEIQESILLSTIGIGGFILFTPLFGNLADKIGPRKLMLCSGLLTLLSSYVIYMLLGSEITWKILLAQLILTLLSSCMSGSMHLYLIALFPHNIRCLGVSFGFTTGIALFGGTMPFISNNLIHLTGDIRSPSYYLMGCSLCLLYVMSSRFILSPIQNKGSTPMRYSMHLQT